MKRLLAAVLVPLLVGCVTLRPAVEPQPHGGTCETAHANVMKLGGCGLHTDTLIKDCHDEERNSGVEMPHDCVTEAKTCEEVRACT